MRNANLLNIIVKKVESYTVHRNCYCAIISGCFEVLLLHHQAQLSSKMSEAATEMATALTGATVSFCSEVDRLPRKVVSVLK